VKDAGNSLVLPKF